MLVSETRTFSKKLVTPTFCNKSLHPQAPKKVRTLGLKCHIFSLMVLLHYTIMSLPQAQIFICVKKQATREPLKTILTVAEFYSRVRIDFCILSYSDLKTYQGKKHTKIKGQHK